MSLAKVKPDSRSRLRLRLPINGLKKLALASVAYTSVTSMPAYSAASYDLPAQNLPTYQASLAKVRASGHSREGGRKEEEEEDVAALPMTPTTTQHKLSLHRLRPFKSESQLRKSNPERSDAAVQHSRIPIGGRPSKASTGQATDRGKHTSTKLRASTRSQRAPAYTTMGLAIV